MDLVVFSEPTVITLHVYQELIATSLYELSYF